MPRHVKILFRFCIDEPKCVDAITEIMFGLMLTLIAHVKQGCSHMVVYRIVKHDLRDTFILLESHSSVFAQKAAQQPLKSPME